MEKYHPKTGCVNLCRFFLPGFFFLFILLLVSCQPLMLRKEAHVVPPRVISRPVLNYPKEARKLNESGEVQLLVLINVSGKVLNSRVKVSSSHEVLDKAALDYVRKITFEPGLKDGEPTAMWITMNMHFSPESYEKDIYRKGQDFQPVASVSDEEMQRVFQFLKTPYDQGVVYKTRNTQQSVNCPRVFRYQDQWYMSFVISSDHTYETWLTSGETLTQWHMGKAILPKTSDSWDADIKIGAISLINPDFKESPSPISYNGSYWMIYLGARENLLSGKSAGIGAAHSEDFNLEQPWERLENPVMTVNSQDFDNLTRESGCRISLFYDKQFATGYPFVMLSYLENTLTLLGSNDLQNWYQISGQTQQIRLPKNISDLQMIRVEDLYILVYTSTGKQGNNEKKFACSKNMFTWTYWKGDPLLSQTNDIYESCLLTYGGTVYHFYTLKENGNTSIALSTSKPIE